jgi:Fe2+ or Zn2+ uptake regulation protein
MRSSIELLREAGLRNTAPRRAVIEVLRAAPHATAPQIAEELGRLEPAVEGKRSAKPSHQGLYNVLEDLRGAGVIRCIEPAGSSTRYELRVGDNHHHVICRRCGFVADVDCHTGPAPCLIPIDDNGFRVIDEAEVTWWGVCEACASAEAPPSEHQEH